MSPPLFVVTTKLGAQGKRYWRLASMCSRRALSQEAPELFWTTAAHLEASRPMLRKGGGHVAKAPCLWSTLLLQGAQSRPHCCSSLGCSLGGWGPARHGPHWPDGIVMRGQRESKCQSKEGIPICASTETTVMGLEVFSPYFLFSILFASLIYLCISVVL